MKFHELHLQYNMTFDFQRNAALNPYFLNIDGPYYQYEHHHFDFHIAQDFFVDIAGKRNTIQVNFDIINVGNLFNKSWGLYNQTATGYDLAPLTTKIADGVASYQFRDPGEMVKNKDIPSRWHAQVGLKYIF